MAADVFFAAVQVGEVVVTVAVVFGPGLGVAAGLRICRRIVQWATNRAERRTELTQQHIDDINNRQPNADRDTCELIWAASQNPDFDPQDGLEQLRDEIRNVRKEDEQ